MISIEQKAKKATQLDRQLVQWFRFKVTSMAHKKKNVINLINFVTVWFHKQSSD
jgi:hypothetical protein